MIAEKPLLFSCMYGCIFQKAVEAGIAKFGRLDCLINNVGTCKWNLQHDVYLADTNCTSYLRNTASIESGVYSVTVLLFITL